MAHWANSVENSNTKLIWTRQHPTRLIGGWAPEYSCSFSSCALSSRRGGISVGLDLQLILSEILDDRYINLNLRYAVAYTLGIYLLNLFLAFLSPRFDPSLTQDEGLEDGDAGSSLPTKNDDEFRPFIRRLPEFKFWHKATVAISIGFLCSWFEIFDIPVFWPVLVVYWLVLFFLTSKSFCLSTLYMVCALFVPICPITRAPYPTKNIY